MKPFFNLLIFLFSIFAVSQQIEVLDAISPTTGLIIKDDVTRSLIHNSSGDRAHNYVQRISLWDRQQNTKDFNTAAAWVAKKAKEFGLENVEIEKYVSDGKIKYYGEATPPTWVAKKGELWVKSPYNFKVTSYADLPMSLGMNSYSVKANAELVDIGAGAKKDYEGKDLKGKIVLTSSSPYRVIRNAVWDKGAIGIISYYSVPYWDKPNKLEGDYLDQVGWGGIPMNDDKEKQSFTFMISERKAKELKSLLSSNKKVVMFVDIETEHKADDFNVISGIIKGSKYPDEEIVITAHIDHYKPGANDNASGSAVCLEMIRTLNFLIESKQLPRPLRTIRFLWLPEFSGTKAWFSRHINEDKKRILNLNMDMLGADLVKANSTYAISYTPDWNASYINAFATSLIDFLNQYNNSNYPRRKDFHIISVNGTRNKIQAHQEPYTRGSDHQIFNDFGIPGIAFGTWPDNFYHSSEDTPDKVDPTQLHRVVFSGLSTLAMVAYADSNNIFDILSLVEMYGYKRLQNDDFEARKIILNATDKNLKDNFYYAKKIMHYAFKREIESLESCLQLANTNRAKNLIENKKNIYKTKQILMIVELESLAESKARQLNIDFKNIKNYNSNIGKEKIVPKRVKGKEIFSFYDTYDVLGEKYKEKYYKIYDELDIVYAKLREREVSELRIYDFENTISSYADGEKSLQDIRDALFAEYKIEIPLQTIKSIFEIFEKARVMTFKKK